MRVFLHETKMSKNSFLIWTFSIAFMIVLCIAMYPDMKSESESMATMFSDMGSFSSAFGLDQVNFGQIMGFYGIECGNILGIGGALFAAVLGISSLSKEEKGRTAEFLITHPVSRFSIVMQKLLSVVVQITMLNLIVCLCGIISFNAIGEECEIKTFLLLHLGYYLLQIELAFITFGISAFIRQNGFGIGMGIAIFMYFINIVANLSDKVDFLKYITPFGYAEASDIISQKSIDTSMLIIGGIISTVSVVIGVIKYSKKDIVS